MNVSSFTKAVIGTFSTEVTSRILHFLTIIIIVRKLSPKEFGIFSLFMSFALTLCYLSTLGVPQAIIFFIGKSKQFLASLVSNYLYIFFFLGISVSTTTYLFRNYPLHSFLRDLPSHYVLPLLIIYFFTLLDTFLLSIVRSLKRFSLFNIRRLLTPVVTLLGILSLYFASSLTLNSVVAIFTTVSVVLTLCFLIKTLSITSFHFKIDWITIRSFMGYGIKSYLQILAGHLIYQVDLYILAYLLGAKQVAFYSIAVGLATLLWYFPNTVGLVLFPTLSSEHDEEQIHLFSAQVCRHTLLITCLGAICLAFTGKYFILLFYGPEYTPSIQAMLIILPGIVVMSVYKVLVRNFSSRNRHQFVIVVAVFTLFINLCLNFALIPKYGINGAALASTISYIFAAIALVIVLRLESKVSLRKMLVIDFADIRYYRSTISQLQKKLSTSWVRWQ